MSIFYTHRQQYGIGKVLSHPIYHSLTSSASSQSLWPPTQTCTNPDCRRANNGFKLQCCEAWEVILYTVAHGAVAVHLIHLMCDAHNCQTNYHHNFYVCNGQRYYYGEVPDIIQVGEHQFAEMMLWHMWHINCDQAWYSVTFHCWILFW